MLYLLVYVLLPLVLAGFLFIWAYALLRRRQAALNTKQRLRLQQLLNAWQIHENISLSDVNRHLSILWAFMLFGCGFGLILEALITACIALLTTGTLLAGNSSRGQPLIEVLLLLGFAGYFFGALAGLNKLRRESLHRITFGDLRRRLTADYRSLWLQIIPVVLGMVNIIAALVSIVSFHAAMIRILLMNDTTVQLPVWILLILPVASLLIVAGVEMSISRIVGFPRLVITADPALSQRIDDMLRSIMIGSLIGIEYCMAGSLQMTQFRLLVTSFSVNPD